MLIWRVIMSSKSVMDDIKIKVGKVIGESSKYQKKKCLWKVRESHMVSQMSMSTELEI